MRRKKHRGKLIEPHCIPQLITLNIRQRLLSRIRRGAPLIKQVILVIVGFFLVVVGSIFITKYSTSSELIKPYIYVFEFNAKSDNESLNFEEFILQYDFTLQEGKIRFNVSKSDSLESLSIEFPAVLKDDIQIISNYDFKNKTKVYDWRKYSEKFLSPNLTYLVIWDFIDLNNNTKEELEITIKYKMDNVLPSGIFIINNINKKIIFDDYDGIGINLIPGNRYICTDDCVDSLEGLKEYRLSYPINLSLSFESEQPRDYFRFKLNSIDNSVKTDRELKLGFGISFVTSGLILCFEAIAETIEKRVMQKR